MLNFNPLIADGVWTDISQRRCFNFIRQETIFKIQGLDAEPF